MKDSTVSVLSKHLHHPSLSLTNGIQDEAAEADVESIVAVPLSFEEYEEIERRKRRYRSCTVWSLVTLATICLPIAYLQMTGQFSLVGLAPHNWEAHPRLKDIGQVYNVAADAKRSTAEKLHFDRIKTDLNEYVSRDLKTLSPAEKIAVIAFSNVIGGHFVDMGTTLLALKRDVIPAQEQLIAKASAIHLRTPEVNALNSQLLLSAKMRLIAYRQMLAGANDPDALWRYAFEAEMKDADDKAQVFHTRLSELAAKTGVPTP